MKTMRELSNQERLQAIKTRDKSYDGLFVYGVKTTGVYCRPSCPSKRSLEANIELFDTPVMAEEAGYRACKRCEPSNYYNPNEVFVERITNYITEHLDTKLTLTALAAELNVSKYHLQRTFKQVLGVTPRQYAEAKRLEAFKHRIRDGEKVESAMYGSGFTSRSRLYEKVPEKIGMTPTEYREGGVDVSISYSIFETPLTRVLVARTSKGICALYMGESDDTLVASLKEEYPYAEHHRDDNGLPDVVEAVNDYFSGKEFNPRLPLDIHKTAFQWRVYKAIQEIPAGTTKTYTELAESIDKPKAVRAVAGACTRAVALLIPCHRVLRKNDSYGGYRWGLPLKEWLLKHEKNEKMV